MNLHTSMKQQYAYGTDQVMESMLDTNNILDDTIKKSYNPIIIGRGKRQQLVKSEGRFCIAFRFQGKTDEICYRIWKEKIPNIFERYRLDRKSVV